MTMLAILIKDQRSKTRIGGVMVSMLTSSAVDRGFEPHYSDYEPISLFSFSLMLYA